MQNVNVTTNVTELIPEGNRSGATLLIQNQSDTTMRVALGSNVPLLSATVGIQLEPGEIMTIDGASASRRIAAIHGGAGNKVCHWQIV